MELTMERLEDRIAPAGISLGGQMVPLAPR
jgi:hypothetical protein